MSEFSPIGWGSIVASWHRSASFLPLLLSAFALSVLALLARVAVARRSMARMDAHGAGRMLDGRLCIRGRLESPGGSTKKSGSRLVLVEYTSDNKTAVEPGAAIPLSTEIQVALEGGRSVTIPKGSMVLFEVELDAEAAKRKDVRSRRAANGRTVDVQITAKEHATVWLVAHASAPVDEGALRTGAQISLTSLSDLALYFSMPRAEETRFLGIYVVCCACLATAVWSLFADGWRGALVLSQGLWIALALVSLKNSLKFRRALDERG